MRFKFCKNILSNYFVLKFTEYLDPTTFRKRSSTLDEITNKVFEDLLKGKSQSGFDDLGVLDIDARSSKVIILCIFIIFHF